MDAHGMFRSPQWVWRDTMHQPQDAASLAGEATFLSCLLVVILVHAAPGAVKVSLVANQSVGFSRYVIIQLTATRNGLSAAWRSGKWSTVVSTDWMGITPLLDALQSPSSLSCSALV